MVRRALSSCAPNTISISIGNLVDSLTRRVGELFFNYEYLREFEAKIGTAGKVVYGTHVESDQS